MPTRRMIDPAIWQSESMAELTRDQRLLFIGLFSNADDQGRLRGNPNLIRSQVFPFDEDITVDDIRHNLQAIARQGCILLYEIDNKEFIQLTKWWDYQSPQWAYPSKYEAPPGWHDRLRYRKDNSVIVFNWKPDHSDYVPPPDDPDEPQIPPQLSGSKRESLPKALGKDLGGVIELELVLDYKNQEKKETRARHKDFSKICTAYQYEIGGLSAAISDILDDDLKIYPADWITEAMKRAAKANIRRYDYVQGILKNWQVIGGPQNDNPQKDKTNGHHKQNHTTSHTQPSNTDPDRIPSVDIYADGWQPPARLP